MEEAEVKNEGLMEKGRRTANTAESALFTFIGTLSSSGNLSISPHSIAKIGDFVADKEKQ